MSFSGFKILSPYTEVNGIDVMLDGRKLRLTHDDVSYLLAEVDGHAVHDAENPPREIGFMLYGRLILMSNEQWMDFVDQLGSAAAQGGWHV